MNRSLAVLYAGGNCTILAITSLTVEKLPRRNATG